MIDLKAARNDPDGYRAALARKGAAAIFDELLAADEARRAVQTKVEELRARTKLKGKPTPEQLEEMKAIKEQQQPLEAEFATWSERVQELLDRVPNPPAEDTPDGDQEEDAVEEKKVGEPPSFDFEPKDHLELSAPHGWIDVERGAKVSGSRFVYRVGDVALLETALYRWALARIVAKGHVPVLPPVLVREEALYGTGFLPDTEQQIYTLPDDDLYLVGTSEVPLASLHAGDILEEAALPVRYAGFSTCFRREAGAAGKDTRGIFRVHQFDKVEMFSFVRPEDSEAEHERLLAIEEEILQELGIPYRVVNIGVGDLGASAAKKYDCEAWMPGQGRYREVTSTSNTTDFQARRLKIRYRPSEGAHAEVLHTLNGTAVTWRHMIALLENGQREDGSVVLPGALAAYGAPATLPPPEPR